MSKTWTQKINKQKIWYELDFLVIFRRIFSIVSQGFYLKRIKRK